jgi:hypothetical protein
MIVQCYRTAVARYPKLSGHAKIKFLIATDGTVAECAVKTNTIPDCTAVRCVCDSVRSIRFPQFDSEAPLPVSYPIIF